MSEIVNIAVDINQYSGINPVVKTLENEPMKPVIICGWCGAIEEYISDDKTECPNCDEYLH